MPNSEPARVSLEPCPFCGETAEPYEAFPNMSYPWIANVDHGGDCPMRITDSHCYADEGELVAAWNRRTPPTSPGWQDYERGLEDAAKVADETREKFGSPVGSAYDNGQWDQSIRIAAAIRALKSPAAPEQQP